MSAYQDFMKVFAWVKSKNPLGESLPLSSYQEKLALYERMGAKSKEDMDALFDLRTRSMIDYIEHGLPVAKYFEVDKVEKRLMLLTDTLRNVKTEFNATEEELDEVANNMVRIYS
jgi:hypothetical protein